MVLIGLVGVNILGSFPIPNSLSGSLRPRMMKSVIHGAALEEVYASLHRAELIHPDPLEWVYRYDLGADREVAGLIAASLAYGRVAQILRSLETLLGALGPSPHAFLLGAGRGTLAKSLGSFKHRWTTGEETCAFLEGIGTVLRRHGGLEACFAAHHEPGSGSTVRGLEGFVGEVQDGGGSTSLLPAPGRGSACKRFHLFLRWMGRSDAVDPGCWSCIDPAHLVVPLDTHMHKVALGLNFTERKQADLKTALEVTDAFRAFSPEDPLRYDFALTRLGIRREEDLPAFLDRCRGA